jgi:predicted TIM-barrel fold metal-dependent hydrolase
MIDTHIHLVPPRLPGTGSLSPLLAEPASTVLARLLAEMQAAGITQVLAMGEWNTPAQDPLGILRTLQLFGNRPEIRVIGVADPVRGDDPEHLRRCDEALASGRVVALKAYLGYLHYAPADPNYRGYYELAAKHRIPVIFHTGDTYSPDAKLKFAHPLGVDEVAVDHPETRFVLAHCGNPWLMDAAQVVYKNLNVWADLSGLLVGDQQLFTDPDCQDLLADLRASLGRAFRYAERPNRFVFGSDWPLIPMAAYRDFIASVIPPLYHEQIFLENARLLFRLDSR